MATHPDSTSQVQTPDGKIIRSHSPPPALGNQPSMDDRLPWLPGAPAFVTLMRLGVCHVL